MTSETKQPPNRDTGCPKQPWIMLTFSDDEALAPGAELPAGLRFHLSRCPSCRAIAERLSAVSVDLNAMASDEAHDELADRASSRARSALFSGAPMTGRVTIEDDAVDPWSSDPVVGLQGLKVRPLIALAACAGMILGLVAMWRLIDRPGQRSQQFTVDSWRAPTRTNRPDPHTVYDLAGPSEEWDVEMEASDADTDAVSGPVYVLAPEDPNVLRRRAMPASTATKAAAPTDPNPAYPDRFLDNPASAVSTVNSTKDRQ